PLPHLRLVLHGPRRHSCDCLREMAVLALHSDLVWICASAPAVRARGALDASSQPPAHRLVKSCGATTPNSPVSPDARFRTRPGAGETVVVFVGTDPPCVSRPDSQPAPGRVRSRIATQPRCSEFPQSRNAGGHWLDLGGQ